MLRPPSDGAVDVGFSLLQTEHRAGAVAAGETVRPARHHRLMRSAIANGGHRPCTYREREMQQLAIAARKAVRRGADGELALSYVIWPTDEQREAVQLARLSGRPAIIGG